MSDDETLAMNPFVDIHVHPPPTSFPIDPSRIETITVKCPLRGRGLVIRDLTRAVEPELFGFFLGLVEREGELELDSDSLLVPALRRLGFLVVEEEIVDWPQFQVPLGPGPDQPASGEAAPDATWVVSQTFLFQPSFALHPGARWPHDYEEQEGRLRCFAPGPAFWLGDPAELLTSFWVGAETADLVGRLVAGRAPPPLPSGLARALASVEAIVPRDRARPSPLARFRRGHAAFAAERYVVVRDLLAPAELAALHRYYAALHAGGLLQLGDRQNRARFSSYNDPIGRFVHARLAAAMSAVAGQPVVPSFSFFFSYIAGAELAPHKDRPEAEFSISLQLDYTPAPADETGWPLRFSFDDGQRAAAELRIGDAVFYHGTELTHHRDELPSGHRSSHLILEYVPADFAGLLI